MHRFEWVRLGNSAVKVQKSFAGYEPPNPKRNKQAVPHPGGVSGLWVNLSSSSLGRCLQCIRCAL